MKAGEEETRPTEILVIRRRGGGEEGGHHGGVWKIAYADFMTAMMAFFLVMWLINSTDKKTLTQVATYFNPMRLTDKSPSAKGVHQMESGPTGKEKASGSSKQENKQSKDDGHTETGKPKYTEELLFRDPPGLLEKLAGQAASDQRLDTGAKGNSEGRLISGEAYRDPFDPAFRRETPDPPSDDPKADTLAKQKQIPARAQGVPGVKEKGASGGQAQTLPEMQAQKAKEELAKANEEAAKRAEAMQLEAQIKDAFSQSPPGTLPNIDVTVTEDGVLISLTDDYDFGMFAIASAEPRPATVLIMEKIAKVLLQHPERLVLRGHTDGRPYKTGTYDNWRLSTARAHMAYYMLVRGGIEEKRFERVEGYADRSLRVPKDPEAAQNRRIEILLRKAKP